MLRDEEDQVDLMEQRNQICHQESDLRNASVSRVKRILISTVLISMKSVFF